MMETKDYDERVVFWQQKVFERIMRNTSKDFDNDNERVSMMVQQQLTRIEPVSLDKFSGGEEKREGERKEKKSKDRR